MTAMKFGVGARAPRKEDTRFLTGRGRYVDDIDLPGLAHAIAVRSPVAHGRIVSLDVEAARAAPGVLAVLTAAETKDALAPLVGEFPLKQVDGSPPAHTAHPHCAEERVRFVGQVVAFVVAETPRQARDAADLVEVDYEEEPVCIRAEEAVAEGAPQLHDSAPGNLAYLWEIGDAAATEAAFARAARVSRVEVRNQRVVVASMEPRAIVARYDQAEDRWEVWCGSQGTHTARRRLAGALKVEPERIRVHTPDVGGGFGMKLMATPEHGLAAFAAKLVGRPVKWIGDRTDAMLSDPQGRDLETEAEGAFDAEGRILAFRWKSYSNLGAYFSSFGAGIHTAFSGPIIGGMYRLPAAHYRVEGVFTNTTPTDAYRGAGRPEVIYVTERLMEQAARDFGRDPAEFRKLNLLTPEELPYKNVGGLTFDSLAPAENVDRCLEAADRAGFEARAAESLARGRTRGFGLCYYMERTGGQPVERAEIVIGGEGRTTIRVGTQSNGQGHETAWAQVAHEKLGVDWSLIELLPGDSDMLRIGGGTGGSRSAIAASRTLMKAADALIEKGRSLASERLEVAPADIEFSPEEGGRYRIAGTDRSVGLLDIATEAGGLDGDGEVDDLTTTFPNGAHAAEVEIDLDTGRLTLVRYSIVDDFGRLLNPSLVEGQVHGGVVQGLGQALMEAAAWDLETGQPQAASFMDYAMPRAADTPNLPVIFNENAPSPTNPLGLKGCGEAGAVAAVPAITLAALDALRRAGVDATLDTPLTAEKLWRALHRAASRSAIMA